MAVPASSTYSPAGPMNVFIPGYDPNQRARLIVEFARNPKEFDLNRYITIMPVEKIVGLYPMILPSDYIRVNYADGRDALHTDGQPSGVYTNNYQGTRRTNIQYQLTQYWREHRLGYITRDQSPFDEVKIEMNRLASVSMTYRTIYTLAKALNTANYASDHTGTATALGGGFWSQGSLTDPFIQKSLSAIRDRILLDTNAKVKLNDLQLVISPTLASAMSQSQEIRYYLAQQANSLAVLKGETPDAAINWMLPNPLYGFTVVIETAPKVTTLPTDNLASPTDGTASYCMDSNTALIVARPGSLVSDNGGVNFSTLHFLEKNDHAFKTFTEDMGEREQFIYLRVEDYFEVIVAAPQSGFVVTHCLS